MAYTKAKLEWSCLECAVFEGHSGTKCRGIITGMIEPRGWRHYVEGIVVSEKDWDKGILHRKGLIEVDLRKLKQHREHKVTILLTGERLRKMQRIVGMISEEE